MRSLTTIILVLVGITGLTQIVLGMLFWSDHAQTLIPLHIQAGSAFVILLWALAALAAGAGRAPGLAGLTFFWGVAVAVIGILHAQWLPGETPLGDADRREIPRAHAHPHPAWVTHP